jgi:translation initiation factor 2D
MFKKALAHQSNATPLRSSARRGLVSGVMSAFPALGESLANNGNDNESASSGLGPSPEKELGRALIPEGVRSANFETSGGVEGVSS